MTAISSINFGKNNGNFCEKHNNQQVKECPELYCLTIRLSKDFIDLIFKNEQDLICFCTAMYAFSTDTFMDKENDE